MTVATQSSLLHEILAGVDTVVFDVVGTLLEPAPSVSEAYKKSAEKFGVSVPVGEIAQRFSIAWERQESLDAQNKPAFITHRRREYDRWRQIVFDVFEASPAADKIFDDLWIHFGKPSSWQPVDQGCRLLETVREFGIEVAVASNFDERLLELAKHVEPLNGIEKIFASSELGWRKPAPQFFQAVESRLQKEPESLLLIGDDPRLDIAAAKAAGWKSMRIG